MSADREALIAAVEAMYPVFAKYTIGALVEGCPCCVSEEEQRTLAKAPLRRIPEAVLSRYSGKALTTWGGVDEFRHFVPPIWEGMTLAHLGVPQIVYGKLTMADFAAWPAPERHAIADVTERWMGFALAEMAPGPEEIIESAGRAGLPVGGLVEQLDHHTAIPSASSAATLVLLLQQLGGRDEMRWYFWKDDREQRLAAFIKAEAKPHRARLLRSSRPPGRSRVVRRPRPLVTCPEKILARLVSRGTE